MNKFIAGGCLLLSVLTLSCTSGIREKGEIGKTASVEQSAFSQEQVKPLYAQGFKLTYADEGYLYICIGYGKQESGGYSVTVNDLYETENAIYVNTNLLGPKAGSTPATSPSYPYIVLKVEFREKTVVFD